MMNLVRRNLQGKAGWIFLLGTTNEEDKPHLENESRTFKDILQADFPDTYPFLSYKVIMSFIWINRSSLKKNKISK